MLPVLSCSSQALFLRTWHSLWYDNIKFRINISPGSDASGKPLLCFAGDPAVLYESVHQRLFSLPEGTVVYSGHDYKGRTSSTVGEEKRLNPRLTKPKEEFIDIMNNLGLPYPKKIGEQMSTLCRSDVAFVHCFRLMELSFLSFVTTVSFC